MPTSRNSQPLPKKNQPAKKQWKAVPSKPSATSKKNNTAQSREVIELFKRYYPDAHCALDHQSPFQLLVATILSAQCTDVRVNLVTPALFAEFPGPAEMAEASVARLELLIRSTGFYKNKAKNIKASAQTLMKEHQGKVPQNLDDLTRLAGVGRKTANVVLGNAFQIISGIVVDTHVTRLSNRLGWVRSQNAEIIERELQKIIPHEDWIMISHWLITHGREVCKARTPLCNTCFLSEHCPKII